MKYANYTENIMRKCLPEIRTLKYKVRRDN